MSYRKSEVIID